MTEMIAYCGLVCSNCPTFIATKNDDDEARAKTAAMYAEVYGFNLKPEEINCDGCLTIGRRQIGYCQTCGIRQCCSKKGLENCVHCAEHKQCEKIKSFHKFSLEAKACFEALKDETCFSSLDPVQYKAEQRQAWDSLAAGWDKWWPTQEQALQCVSDRLVDLAEIQPGNRVLDIGTGIGEPAITASLRVGPSGYVVATDLSPQMLTIAKKRATELKIQNLEFRVMDAEAMDFPESTFDAILCRFSLMFLTDLADVLARIRLMLAPGGKFAASVWDVAPKNPLFSLAYGLAQKMFQLQPPPAGTPTIFDLAEGILEQALLQAGFTNVHAESLSSTSELPSAEMLTQFLRDVNAPLVGILAAQPAQRQAEYWQAFIAAVQEYTASDGSIHIPGTAICVVGQR